MTSILHIDSSSNTQGSVTREIGTALVASLTAKYPGSNVVKRDLVADPLPHVSTEFVETRHLNQGTPALALSDALIKEIKTADILVIDAPMYNFGIPSALKAWIDHIVRPGQTFSYIDGKPKGLIEGKKVFLVVGRGGVYSSGPMQAYDHQESYLRAVLGFIGLTDIESIRAEGVAYGPEAVAKAKTEAKQTVEKLLAAT